jgi:hypothetical protein
MQASWLTSEDTMAVLTLCDLWHEMRTHPNGSKEWYLAVDKFQRLIGKLGLTPSDRAGIKVPKKVEDDGLNRFFGTVG